MSERDEDDLAAERQALRDAFEEVCPYVLDNPFIPHQPLPAQAVFLGRHLVSPRAEDPSLAYECLYGGAAGGGKSDALLMAAAQYAWRFPEFAGVCIRRSYAELAQPDALMDRAMKWWLPAGCHWNGTDKLFTFPSGARVKMAYHGTAKDDLQFQGAQYQFAGWDELTHWPDPSAYEWVSLTRVRRLEGSKLPLRALSASNPGGPGHAWVKNRFVGGRDITGRYVDPTCDYIPARLKDNPYLDRRAYEASLMRIHPTTREQLLNGDWSARDPGDYFRAEWFGSLLDPETDTWPPEQCMRIRWWDLAASIKEDASRTVGVRMARHVRGVRAIEHVRAGRWTPGTRDEIIVQTAMADGRGVIVGIEIEGGSGGIAQYLSLEKRLRGKGFRVVGARPGQLKEHEKDLVVRNVGVNVSSKTGRADPVAACLERGYIRRGEAPHADDSPYWGLDLDGNERDGIRLFAGEWTQAYLDAIEGFPPEEGKEGVDEVDATSGAWAWLEAHPLIHADPERAIREKSRYSHDRHPDEEDDPEHRGADQDDRGIWMP